MVVAILGVGKDQQTGQRLFNVIVTGDYKSSTCRSMPESALVAEVNRGRHKLVNAKIDNGKIVDKYGNFGRLTPKSGITPVVVLSTIETSTGRVVGYVISTLGGKLARVKKEELLMHCKSAKASSVPFVQNMIYRETNGVEQLAEFENQNLPVIQLSRQAPPPSAVPTRANVDEPEKQIKPVKPVQKEVEAKPVKAEAPARQRPVSKPKPMSEAQNKELEACKNAGVNPMLISSPKLSPQKQRVIWAAKKNGVPVEFFTNPAFTKEQMIFFADRLENDANFSDFIPFIDPRYSVDQMRELYLGVCSGVDIREYLDETLTPEEMYVKRYELEADAGFSSVSSIASNSSCVRNFVRRLGLEDDTHYDLDYFEDEEAHA